MLPTLMFCLTTAPKAIVPNGPQIENFETVSQNKPIFCYSNRKLTKMFIFEMVNKTNL
jgi:hypothetical protein